MSDLVKQLRVTENSKHFDPYTRGLAGDAADEIERMQTKLAAAEKMIEALKEHQEAETWLDARAAWTNVLTALYEVDDE